MYCTTCVYENAWKCVVSLLSFSFPHPPEDKKINKLLFIITNRGINHNIFVLDFSKKLLTVVTICDKIRDKIT